MRFMEAIDHAFKITHKGCPNGTEINMYKHKEGYKEAYYYMNKVIHSQSAAA